MTVGMRLWRSLLYVPACEPERVEKALASDADCVIVDLEDSVPLARKDEALEFAHGFTPRDRDVLVRVNSVGAGSGLDELRQLATLGFQGFRLPKVEDPAEVAAAGEVLDRAGATTVMYLLVESARGVERLMDLATAHPRVAGICLGEADLKADLAVTDDAALDPIRSRVVSVSRAAELDPPVCSVYTRTQDDHGLIESTRRARAWGFFGRSVIHPRQIVPVNAVFTPTEDEVVHARALIQQLDEAAADGRAALTTADGRFIDPAVVRAARRTVTLHDAFGTGGPDQLAAPDSGDAHE
jgi:citrate lyase subunit beta/citryl-CoA lyase